MYARPDVHTLMPANRGTLRSATENLQQILLAASCISLSLKGT